MRRRWPSRSWLLMFLLVFLQWWLLGNRSYQTVTGKGYSPGIMKLGTWRWVTFSICVLFFILTVALPVGQLLVGSFFQSLRLLQLGHADARALSSGCWRTASSGAPSATR